ncbi:AMP-binding protein [Actinomycetospora soli]|uniref:AMP-binding protein n=1 Tax=Actinomycetospora soli TaxID=2893887 RepID=UPI003556245E
MLYTSGTTSAPKGAIMTNRNLIAQYLSDIVDGEYHRDDVELHALPLYHCAALHDFLTPDVYLGATSIVVDSPDPDTILRTVAAEGVTKMFCPPTVWIRLLRSPAFDRHDLSSLRKGYYGAAIMPVAVLTELGERLPGIRLFNYYGQTELAPNATVLFPEEQITKPGTTGGRASTSRPGCTTTTTGRCPSGRSARSSTGPRTPCGATGAGRRPPPRCSGTAGSTAATWA